MLTLSLLFPESCLLHQPQDHVYPLPEDSNIPASASKVSYDCQGDFTFNNNDIRVIVAQEATSLQPRVVLLDTYRSSKSNEDSSSAGLSHSRVPQTPTAGAQPHRSPQLSHRPLDGAPPGRFPSNTTLPARSSGSGGSMFERPRRQPTSPSASTEGGSRLPTSDSAGGMKLILDCMFGSTPLSYRGNTSKLHIFPADRKSETRSATTSPIIGEGGFGSFGRTGGRRRSQLAQSHTPGEAPLLGSISGLSSAVDPRLSETRTVLITRTFSINLPLVTTNQADSSREVRSGQPSVDSTISFPFPVVDDRFRPSSQSKRPQQQMRSPLYAIALVLQIPVSAPSPSYPAGPMIGSGHSGSIRTASFSGDKVPQWSFLDPDFAIDSITPRSSGTSDIDDQVNVLVERWDVISRVLSFIQGKVLEPITDMLRQVAAASPTVQPPSPSRRLQPATIDESSVAQPKVRPKPTKLSQVAQLLPGALSRAPELSWETEVAIQRLALGLRIPHVVTGQGRWGIWREEARSVGRWGGGKEHKFFFFNLLTAFLGNHTEWLSALSPSWYRHRRRQQHRRPTSAEDHALRHRTIIVSKDKMAARRLIFLLAAFLPASSTAFDDDIPFAISTSTTASNRGFSQSCPPQMMGREESLRRTMNRRGQNDRSSSVRRSKAVSPRQPTPEISNKLDIVGVADATTGKNGMPHGSHDEPRLPAANLPILQATTSRKSSAATTATIVPAATLAHISAPHPEGRSGTTAGPRPGSSGSLASLNLMHTLRRSDSAEQSHHSIESQQASRWGSLVSGFWSHRRTSSTDNSDITIPSEEGARLTNQRRSDRTSSSQGSRKLARIVLQTKFPAVDGDLYEEDLEDDSSQSVRVADNMIDPLASPVDEISSLKGQAIPPRRTKTSEPTFKLSVDEKDGIVDVDIQLPGFFSPGLGSTSTSPSTADPHSFSLCDSTSSLHRRNQAYQHHRQSPACPLSTLETESPVDVAGWLETFHDDFAVQAVRPYKGLENDVKSAMRRETVAPAPTFPGQESENGGWVDQCTSLIADTANFSVRRLRLQRRMRPSSGSPPSVAKPEERFVSEPIFDLDGTLIDAVERIIAQGQPASTANTQTKTPSEAGSGTGSTVGPEAMMEVPRSQCQRMVLGALEHVVKSVAVEREKCGTVDGEADVTKRRLKGSHSTESTLREGVRRWLTEVEQLSC